MRPRIKVKVNIQEIGNQIKIGQDRKKAVFREALTSICVRDSIGIGEAKKVLRRELKWACVKREMANVCSEASNALKS